MPPVIQARNPLRNYQFRIKVVPQNGASAYVAGVKTVSGLRVQVNPWETWEGGNNLHRYANPNKVIWEPVTLEQGLALDNTFETWSQSVLQYATDGQPVSGQPVKREVFIDVWDENMYQDPPTRRGPPKPPPPNAGTPTPSKFVATDDLQILFGARFRSYHLRNAWISKYAPLPKLDAMASEVALLSVELVHEGWTLEPLPPA